MQFPDSRTLRRHYGRGKLRAGFCRCVITVQTCTCARYRLYTYLMVHHSYIVYFFILTYTATVISGHPSDVTVEPNVWANFSCTVQCSYPVEWYKAGHPFPIRDDIDADSRSIAGLESRIPAMSACTSDNKTTYFLQVLATKALNNSAFYCVAYESCYNCPETECKCGCVGSCYSRPAFLRGKPVCILMLLLAIKVIVELSFQLS